MIYLPIKEASKYIERETGINFSVYELLSSGKRGYFNFYIDSITLSNNYRLNPSATWLGYDNHETEKYYRLMSEHLLIQEPEIESDKLLFEGVYSALPLLHRDMLNKALTSLGVKELHLFDEVIETWIAEEDGRILCNLVVRGSPEKANEIAIDKVYIELPEIIKFSDMIAKGTDFEIKSEPKEDKKKIIELWQLEKAFTRRGRNIEAIMDKLEEVADKNEGLVSLDNINALKHENSLTEGAKRTLKEKFIPQVKKHFTE